MFVAYDEDASGAIKAISKTPSGDSLSVDDALQIVGHMQGTDMLIYS